MLGIPFVWYGCNEAISWTMSISDSIETEALFVADEKGYS